MTDPEHADQMENALQAALEQQGMPVSDEQARALIGRTLAWQGGVSFLDCAPILRSFDEAKAREFYCDFLGFTVQFEHRFAPDLPLYMSVARAGLTLHLSEHHGDASPGTTIFVRMAGIREYQRELSEKRYRFGRPGLENLDWGLQMEVHDPFGNRIRFCEQTS